MPSAKTEKKSKGKSKSRKKVSDQPKSSTVTVSPQAALVLSGVFGAVFGLSAPGYDHWYLAWFGLVPLLLLVASSRSLAVALLRGLIFGTAYNLVYLNWLLKLHPLDWLGFNWWQSMLMATAAWAIVALHQGIITAIC